MELRVCLKFCIAFTLGCVFASMALLGFIWRIVRHPVKSMKTIWPKKRDVMPACLNDPAYGTHNYIHLEEVRLHYVACGDESKPLMLFLHGFPEFWYSWRYQIKEFKKDYRVVAVDMRGYGLSDKPSGVKEYHVDKMLTDFKQLITALGYRSCVLVSHDWGGALAFGFAAKYQNMVDKLVVLNAPHPAAFEGLLRSNFKQAKKSWYMMFFQVPFVPELLFSAFDYKAVSRLFTTKQSGLAIGKMSEDDIEAYVYSLSRPGGITNPINYYRAGLRNSLPQYFSNVIEKPTLVIWGTGDSALEKENATLPSKYVSNLTVKYVENASHWVMMDAPEQVNKLMREWL